jgi:hypothetical protein
MSNHLARLIDTGLVTVEPAGRYRFYRLANRDVADLLEHIDAIDVPEVTPLRRPRPATDLAFARSCYDHIAGTLGVQLFQTIQARRFVAVAEQQPRLTSTGVAFFERLGINVEALDRNRRPTVRCCLDWTERRHHLGGGLGAAVLDLALRKQWLTRRHDQRVLRITATGRAALQQHFGFGSSPPRPTPGSTKR